jgi:hypothetical protein
MTKARRDLKQIAKELNVALRRETTDIILIGKLLIEAHEQLVEHGEWLPWLADNFGDSVRTAHNFMAVARFARKFATVANLRLRPTALYLLAYETNHKIIKAILKEAETKWISGTRAHEIAASLQPKPKTVADWTESDDILDDPPPELPPAPETTEHDVILPSFEQAVSTLARLQTKRLSNFVDTAHTISDIRAVSVFLQEVSAAIERERAKPAAREIEKVTP